MELKTFQFPFVYVFRGIEIGAKLGAGQGTDEVRVPELPPFPAEAIEVWGHEGKPARSLEYTDDEKEILHDLHLLSMKPMLYVVNIDEGGQMEGTVEENVPQIAISAKIEAELAELSAEDAKEYMKELDMDASGLDKLITESYKLLNLVTFLTSGEPETRAWTVKAGTKGPEAAGVIHTDFIKGYIKADVCKWEDFVKYNGWNGIKESGKMKLEGKEYIVQDGDTVYFHVAT